MKGLNIFSLTCLLCLPSHPTSLVGLLWKLSFFAFYKQPGNQKNADEASPGRSLMVAGVLAENRLGLAKKGGKRPLVKPVQSIESNLKQSNSGRKRSQSPVRRHRFGLVQTSSLWCFDSPWESCAISCSRFYSGTSIFSHHIFAKGCLCSSGLHQVRAEVLGAGHQAPHTHWNFDGVHTKHCRVIVSP